MGFKKGQSGNPKGRAPSAKFANMLNVALADGDGKRLRRIAEQLVSQAEAGEQWAIREVADRLDGKPQQTIDATVTDDSSLSSLTTAHLLSRMEELEERARMAPGETEKPAELH